MSVLSSLHLHIYFWKDLQNSLCNHGNVQSLTWQIITDVCSNLLASWILITIWEVLRWWGKLQHLSVMSVLCCLHVLIICYTVSRSDPLPHPPPPPKKRNVIWGWTTFSMYRNTGFLFYLEDHGRLAEHIYVDLQVHFTVYNCQIA